MRFPQYAVSTLNRRSVNHRAHRNTPRSRCRSVARLVESMGETKWRQMDCVVGPDDRGRVCVRCHLDLHWLAQQSGVVASAC